MTPAQREKAKQRLREYYLANRERLMQASRDRYAANKPAIAKQRKGYQPRKNALRRAKRDAQPEAVRAAERAWREANPDKVLAQKKRHYYKHQEANIQRAKEWQLANPEATRERKRRYKKSEKGLANRRSPRGVLSDRMRRMIHRALRHRKGGRSWASLVGYSYEELQRHMERQFVNGMSWANAGDWHIDHIIPLSSFSFTDESDPEFKRAWALANLRPLWGAENMSKGARIVSLL